MNAVHSRRIVGSENLRQGSSQDSFGNAGLSRGANLSSKGTLARRWRLYWLGLGTLLALGLPAMARSQGTLGERVGVEGGLDSTAGTAAIARQMQGQAVAGTISGSVVDVTGAAVVGARIRISEEDPSVSQEVVSDGEGQYLFASIAPGTFQLTAAAGGFAPATFSGTLHSGESFMVPPITLTVASASSQVQVTMSRFELAEAEIKDEERQRVLGVVPNFYVTYDPAALPLSPKQKFELAFKSTFDPISIGLVGATAGIQQATDSFNGYGQGAAGYGKRYGASYADLLTGTFIGSAILPSLLKQDPRYFYKGKGSVRSRFFYAIANAVICKGDNGHWQTNYSALLGGLAAGGISNLYYPATDRGAELTFENAAIGIGTSAAANILQEFLIRRLTPHAPTYAPAAPTP